MSYLFPAAFLMNSFSMTALLVFFGLVGETHLAADIGLVQGVMLALFYAFSANARNIILNDEAKISVNHIFFTRIILILPLGIIAYSASFYMGSIDMLLALALIVRRSVEWIGELHLSLRESSNDGGFAKRYSILEGSLFLLVVAWYLAEVPMPVIGMLIWAVVPLGLHAPFIGKMMTSPSCLKSLKPLWNFMMPQLGSTMIIGVSVYVFRLMIVLVTGKSAAGDLFTAFALGGIIGSLFAQILGPSVVHYESKKSNNDFTTRMDLFLVLYVVVGVVLFFAAYYNLDILMMVGKSSIFWCTVGASMVGGAIMVHAQYSKCRLLQTSGEANLFGPDVFINIIVIACVPYLYYIVSHQALTILYLISATLSYVMYRRAEEEYGREKSKPAGKNNQIVATVIVLFMLLPVFFQIQGGIFREPFMVLDSGGLISRLPIPISVLGCFAGIIFMGHFSRAYAALCVIFFSVLLMLTASLLSTYHQDEATQAKLIFILQFILPMFALVLGQQYEALDPKMIQLRKTFLCVLCIVVPLQLLSTYMQGAIYLSPYLYFFSIYQHWQYVPVVFASAFMLVFYGCWEEHHCKRILIFFFPVMSVYIAASNSVMALALLIAGTAGYLYYRSRRGRVDKMLMYLLILIITLSAGYTYIYRSWGSSSWNKIQVLRVDKADNLDISVDIMKSPSVSDRIPGWKFYGAGAVRDIKTFWLGNAQRPDRDKYPSAHNYYLDLLYNFGMLSLVPLIGLIGFTIYSVCRKRKEILFSPAVLGLVIVVFFILFVDNFFKVGLRQPYPGIFSFFLWGLLLSKLVKMPTKISNTNDAPDFMCHASTRS